MTIIGLMTPAVPAVALAIGLLITPLAAHAQRAERIYRIGFLSSSLSPTGREGLRQGLRDLGYIEGQRIAIKTAKALGLTIPPSLLLRADQVIE